MYLSENWFYTHPSLPTPISVTHEILQNGRKVTNNCRKRARKQINFNSYHTKKLNLDNDGQDLMHQHQQNFYKSTTYRRDFSVPYPPICPPKSTIDDDVDPLFNRRPLNFFQMLPYAPGKFMDDHFSEPSEARKRINFFRQIRQISYIDKTLK